jgi:hypothetical protein
MAKLYGLVFAVLFAAAAGSDVNAQQVPKKDRAGNSVSTVRNDSPGTVTIEYQSNQQWQQLRLEPGKDSEVPGDRVRVATTRADKAVITVDLPIEPGKKYRLMWNAPSGMWDFSAVP